jgi:hypothetical protein
MPKIQTSCPNCQQPIIAEIQQVIDVGRNPQAKNLILSGELNLALCQVCGFQGQLPVPVIYHDPEKELLFTFSPPDANKTMEEKERELAPLLKNVIDNLEPKDRKGYLFQPRSMLTINNLSKNILLEDGITEEMIKSQQEKMKLLDSLFTQEGEKLKETIRINNDQIDREFFALFAEIAQRILASKDKNTIDKIRSIQDILMKETEIGKEILNETQEIQAASQSLESLGKNLTRSSLLELVIDAPTTERVKALTSLARTAMDYEFFQMFTEKIERIDDKSRESLVKKRNLMLKLTQEIDQQLLERFNDAKEQIEMIISEEPIKDSLMKNLNLIDQYFVQALTSEMELAVKENQAERKGKLEKLMHLIQDLTTPAELKILERLLTASEDEKKINELLKELGDQIDSQLIDYMTSLISNYEEQIKSAEEAKKPELEDTFSRLKTVYNVVLRHSMKMNLEGN